MGVRLTKLADANYFLDQIDDIALEGHEGADPVEYYTQEGNPPGVWIGSGVDDLGFEQGQTATTEQVRDLINKRRNPRTQQVLGDPKDVLDKTDSTSKTVGGWDITFTVPKSLNVIWAMADRDVREKIDRIEAMARDMTMEYIERNYLTTRSGAGGVATEQCDGAMGFMFRHYDNRDGDPHQHEHVVISNYVKRTKDGQWTAIDGRKLYNGVVDWSEQHTNILMDLITKEFGWQWTERPNNRGTKAVVYDIEGVPQKALDLFSSRTAEILTKMAQRVAEEEAAVGHPLTAMRKEEIHAEVWKETRKPKSHEPKPLDTLFEEWRHKAKEHGINPEAMLKAVNSHHDNLIHVDAGTRKEIGTILLHQLVTANTQPDGPEYDPVRDVLNGIKQRSKSTWKRSNIRAEAQRITRGLRVDPEQRSALIDEITDRVIDQCVQLTPTRYDLPDENDLPELESGEGRSLFDDPSFDRFTTTDILDAETDIEHALDEERQPQFTLEEATQRVDDYVKNVDGKLSADQKRAVIYALANPKLVSTIVGPAGSGKTTTMRALAHIWMDKYGPDSVLGVTQSNAAKDELAASIGVQCINLAQYAYWTQPERQEEIRRIDNILRGGGLNIGYAQRLSRKLTNMIAKTNACRIRPNQLIINDEAGMTSTFDIQRIVDGARRAGAALTLVGDNKQLSTPAGPGGMLGRIVSKGGEYHSDLDQLWRFAGATYDIDPERFRDRWAKDDPDTAAKRQWIEEGAATLRLRQGGDPKNIASVDDCLKLIAEYKDHDRIHVGSDSDMEQLAYDMCIAWQSIGKTTLAIAGTNEQVKNLNQRFLMARKLNGESDPDRNNRVPLSDGLDVGIGDQILCRGNDSLIRSADDKQVQNGMVMIVEGYSPNGVRCRETGEGRIFLLPYEYLKENCQAGYATTAHLSQGATVARSVYLIGSQDTPDCNTTYVAGTRAVEENHFLFGMPDEQTLRDNKNKEGTPIDPDAYTTWSMLNILCKHPDDRTAHQVSEDEQRDRYSLKRLIHEHEQLGGDIAQRHLLAKLGGTHDPDIVARIQKSSGFEHLRATWSRAFMTDPRQALAILSHPLPGEKGAKPRNHASRRPTAKSLMPRNGETAGTNTTITLRPDKGNLPQADYLERNLDKIGIPLTRQDGVDGSVEFRFDEAYAPAVRATVETMMRKIRNLTPERFDDWDTFNQTADRHEHDHKPDTQRRRRDPDLAETLAARLNKSLLDRTNGVVNDQWPGGIVPPIKAKEHDTRFDLLQQNERTIEQVTRNLEQELLEANPDWLAPILDKIDDDLNLIRDIAAYRARWTITDEDTPLGEKPEPGLHRQHWANLDARITGQGDGTAEPEPTPTPQPTGEPDRNDIPLPDTEPEYEPEYEPGPYDEDYADIDPPEPWDDVAGMQGPEERNPQWTQQPPASSSSNGQANGLST
ncbi:MobF family relaxase [Bifidobacterium rousetti]|uniref:MobF family relaxase n=1 Tax=Bifidobacterium rousetti TaxID=2045439 RepID=UPI00168AE5C8|nr:MobF family relaxase [Bifidobacterium rousetti]